MLPESETKVEGDPQVFKRPPHPDFYSPRRLSCQSVRREADSSDGGIHTYPFLAETRYPMPRMTSTVAKSPDSARS